MPKARRKAAVTTCLDAGIVSTAEPWSLCTTVAGVLLGSICAIAVSLPVVLLMVTQTVFDTLFWLMHQTTDAPPAIASDDQVVLVLPGTCSYAFWQFGMLQYICEHYDTRAARIAGNSSGAIGAVLILLMERAAEKAKSPADVVKRIRACAQDLFQRGEH
eukprot:4398220-Amphidinium_carterae.1